MAGTEAAEPPLPEALCIGSPVRLRSRPLSRRAQPVSNHRVEHPVASTERLVALCETFGWTVIETSPGLTVITCECGRAHIVALGHLTAKPELLAQTFLHKLSRCPCLEDEEVKSAFGEATSVSAAEEPAVETRFAIDLRGTLPHVIDRDLYKRYTADVGAALQGRGFRDVLIGGAAADRCIEICVAVEAPELDLAIEKAVNEVTEVLSDLGCELVDRIEWLYAQQLTATVPGNNKHQQVA
jgi:hypothetical protein